MYYIHEVSIRNKQLTYVKGSNGRTYHINKIIQYINDGNEVKSCRRDKLNKSEAPNVHVYDEKYIRSDANENDEDNLLNLPQF